MIVFLNPGEVRLAGKQTFGLVFFDQMFLQFQLYCVGLELRSALLGVEPVVIYFGESQ